MTVSWLPDRFDRWLTVEHPVTYWSFWAALVRLIPLLTVPFVIAFFVAGEGFAVRSFAPLPYVFVAATFGYAVRAFDGVGVLISVLLAGIHSFLLWVADVGTALLGRPTPMLTLLSVLAFVALLAGFWSPTLHGQRRDREFRDARRRWEED